MRKQIPTLARLEFDRLKSELSLGGLHGGNPPPERSGAREVAVIFDGTTLLGEAIAIILRYVDESWEIQQRLMRLDIVEKSVTAPQLAQVLHQCLFTRFQFRGEEVLAVMRDGAAVNGAALDSLRPFLPNMFDVVCFSYTLYNMA